MKTKIVKVQIPLFSTTPTQHCLVYDRDRKNVAQQGISEATVKALNGDPKGYFEAEWNEKEFQWNIGKRVGNQPW